MSEKEQVRSTKLDSIKLLAALSIVIAGAVAFYDYKQTSTLLGTLVMLGAIIVAIGISMTTPKGKRAWSFVKDAKVEVRKVVWPTRQETLQTTLIVIVMVLIAGMVIWLMDFALSNFIDWLKKR